MEDKGTRAEQEHSEAPEDLIRGSLAPLKGVGMPPGVRAATQKRIGRALAAKNSPSSHLWIACWRWRISVPFPVAAGFLIASLLLGALQLEHASRRHTVARPPGTRGLKPPIARQERPRYYEEALYVRGMGCVSRERGYRFLEENDHDIR